MVKLVKRGLCKRDLELPSDWRDGDWRKGTESGGAQEVEYTDTGKLSSWVWGNKLSIALCTRGPINDERVIEASDKKVSFRYRDHRDRKNKTLTLATEHFMSRILWHVPVKGQHNVHYYGLYSGKG